MAEKTTSSKSSAVPYAPFKMKAADYGNSPMRKNFGVGDPEAPDKTSPYKVGIIGAAGSLTDFFKKGGKGAGTGNVTTGNKTKSFGKTVNPVQGGDAGGEGAIESSGEQGAISNTVTPSTHNDPTSQGAMFEQGGDHRAQTVPMHGGESHTDQAGAAGGGDSGDGNVIVKHPTAQGRRENKSARFKAKRDAERERAAKMRERMKNLMGGGAWHSFSDTRLKENISQIGNSKSGIPIYKFNYKGNNTIWSGTMAQDLLAMGKGDAVHKDKKTGYYKVDYSKIDINMRVIPKNINN
jgi:hypothetical protein